MVVSESPIFKDTFQCFPKSDEMFSLVRLRYINEMYFMKVKYSWKETAMKKQSREF